MNKTIKKVVNENQETITDQKEILNTVRNYYENLFANKDDDLTDVDLHTIFSEDNIKKLSDNNKNSIETPITLEEIGQVIKKMKNNKSPGSDGFPVEFYKMFWSKLKYFILRSIQETFETEASSSNCETVYNILSPKRGQTPSILKKLETNFSVKCNL